MSRARGLGVPGTDTTRTPRNPAPSARRPAGGPLTRPASLLLRGQAPGAVGFLPWRGPPGREEWLREQLVGLPSRRVGLP